MIIPSDAFCYTSSMLIQDRIYGDINVEKDIIAKLIMSAPLQRLKKISQDGATHYFEPKFNVDRFEHSVGAWYLSKRFNRPIEEQIACLIHDIPHTAFSHVVDFVVGDDSQEFHDKFLEEIVYQSEIPKICEAFNVDIKKILDKSSFPLLDNQTPELSFDRWDYFMRDAHMMGIMSNKLIADIINSAKLLNTDFYFDNAFLASQFCISTIMVAKLGYVSANSHGAYLLLADILKTSLEKNYITQQDLFTTDDEVLAKINKCNDDNISQLLNRLSPEKPFMYADKDSAEYYGKNKARYIDPYVMKDKKLIPVSKIVVGLESFILGFKADCEYIGVKQQI